MEEAPEPTRLNLPLPDLFDDYRREDFFAVCVPLYEASIKGDWIAAKAILDHHRYHRHLLKCSITDNCETMLHVAASAQSEIFMQNLVGMMQVDDLEYQNKNGNTALCLAAITGNVNIARILVNRNQNLLTMRNKNNMIPLYIAALYGKRDMVNYLYANMNQFQRAYYNMEWVCFKCVEVELFDIALRIYQNHPQVVENETQIILGLLARKPYAFNEQNQHIMRRIVNSVICDMERPVTNTNEAIQLLTYILTRIKLKPKNVMYDILRGPPVLVTLINQTQIHTYPSRVLFVAAEMGNTKFIVELIRKYPDLIWKINDDNQTIFHIAVTHRHHNIYNLLYEIGSLKDSIVTLKDPEGNNMLHLVGKMVEKNRLKDVSGAAFQMQLEMLWYKEVESMIPPSYHERKNKKDETPHELFTLTHKNLLTEGEKWMRGTASKCMLVATLIATIVFGVAFTIPGGYDQTSGFPKFLHNGPFIVFVILDAISLMLSSTSILVFLSILTSRYAQEDFIKSLPKKLMVGILMLFLSIVTMMIAFSVSFFVLYREKFIIVAGFISLLALIPIVSYAVLHYPLLMDVFRSTYRSRYLFKPKKQMLYIQNPRF